MATAAQLRRRITAARRKVERARAAEAAALDELGRALADMPRAPRGGRLEPGAISMEEMAELAGLGSRQAVYAAIRRVEKSPPVKKSTDSYTAKGRRRR